MADRSFTQQNLRKQRAKQLRSSGVLFELSELDLADKVVRDKARAAAVEHMREFLAANPNRLLKTLTAPELDGIIQAALTEFIKARAIEAARMPNDPLDDLFM